MNRLENAVVGDEEVRKGLRNSDLPEQVVAYEKDGRE